MTESIEDDRIAVLVLRDNRMKTIAETEARDKRYFLRIHNADLYLVARSEHNGDYVIAGHADHANPLIKEMTWDGDDRLEVTACNAGYWNALPDENKPNPQAA